MVKEGGSKMIYYKIENENIVKYEVTIDIESLKKLRSEIIYKCSRITHECYKTTKTPNYFDWEHILNYHEKKIGVIEYNDFYSSPEDEYLVEYDYYHHPNLVKWIEKLIDGKTYVIEKIENMNEQPIDEEAILLKEQQEIIKDLMNIDNQEINKKIEVLTASQEKILNYQRQKKINKNQVSINDYKNKVLACIQFEKIDRMPIKTILEVQKFLENSKEYTTEKELGRVLTLEKRKQY